MKISAATVRRRREARAWSQEQLATVSGISARTVQRVEGEGVASLETRMALAAALECEPAMLLESAIVEREVLAQPATSSSAKPPGTLSPNTWISLAWLLFAVIAFMVVFGWEMGKDLAAASDQRAVSRNECKLRAAEDGTVCAIDAAEQRAKVVAAE